MSDLRVNFGRRLWGSGSAVLLPRGLLSNSRAGGKVLTIELLLCRALTRAYKLDWLNHGEGL